MSAIVLNRMFVGDYCLQNIGHEIINIFQSDGGKYYVYLNSSGGFAADKKGQVEYILLTRNCPRTQTVQVIGKAKVVKELFDPNKKADQNYDKEVAGIKYGGASIIDLFKANEKGQRIYVTYEVDEIVEPKEKMYLSFGDPQDDDPRTIYINKGEKGGKKSQHIQMARASLKQYIDAVDNSEAYNNLKAVIKDKSKWQKNAVGKVPVCVAKSVVEDNFFKICRIQNDELAFSNAFAYLANKYRMVFCKFAEQILGVPLAENFEIFREKWNIDLLIADRKNVIVIENKVLSHINGLWFDRNSSKEKSQLKKYYDIVTGRENDFNKTDKNGHKEYEGLIPHFFVLAPDHNDIDLNKYEEGGNYEKITYSQVENFIGKQDPQDAFAQQLLLAMVPHCQPSYDFYSEMRSAFLEQCSKVRNLK